MVGEDGDWNSSSTTVTTPWLLSHWWWKFWCMMVPSPYISYQDRACRDWFSHFTSSQPFQSLYISIMNGLTWLRLVYGRWNDHHNLFSSSERVQIWLGPHLLFAPRLCVYWLIHAIHSIPTLPMYHYMYNEWLEKVEIGIHPPEPSPHPCFWVAGGESLGILGPYVSHQHWACADWFSDFTASQPFQSLFISMMNG